MARISLSQMFNSGLRGILNVQAQSMKTQNQIATGKRVLTPSDDPVAAARILQIEQEQGGIVQYKKNIDSAESSLMLEENQLDAVNNLLTRVRELAVKAGGGAMTSSERKSIAAELSERLKELQGLANTRNTSGEYIFGGFQGEREPFVDNGDGTFSYRGDAGQRSVQISDSTTLPIGDSGHDIFVNVRAANTTLNGTGDTPISQLYVGDNTAYQDAFPDGANLTFTFDEEEGWSVVDNSTPSSDPVVVSNDPGEPLEYKGIVLSLDDAPANGDSFTVQTPATQDILTTTQRLLSGLEELDDSEEDKAALQALIANSLDNLDHAESNVGQVWAKVGARLNTLDSTRELHSGVSLVNDKILKEIRDLDYAEAITRLTQENFVLQAAQQSFAKISGLSLFNFLR